MASPRTMGGALRRGSMRDQGALYDFLFNVKEFLNDMGAGLSLEPGSASSVTPTALVACDSSLTMSALTHANRTVALDTAAGSTAILPASTGSGRTYYFLVTVTATSNSHVIKVANATDEFRGFVIQDADTATAPNTWWAADNDDTITLNRTTTGLAAQGEYFEIVDAVAGHYYVRGYSQASGIEATPFSATVS